MKIQNYEQQLFGTFSGKSTKSCVHYTESLPFFNLFFCGVIADTFPYDLGRNKEPRPRFYIIQHIVR